MCAEHHSSREVHDGRPRRSFIASLLVRLDRWADRATMRRILAGMSDAQLKDIGLSRLDANAESRKPFWRA
jgi:uncharacterized protein YjiS (DUF1127 family)